MDVEIGYGRTHTYTYNVLEIAYGGTTIQTSNYYYSGDMLIIESDVLVDMLGMDRYTVEHQAFDLFDEMDHAALAWSLKYWDYSNNSRAELMSYIYHGTDGGYFFDYAFTDWNLKEITGRDKRTDYELAAAIHSHPSVFGYNGNRFSDADRLASYIIGVPVYLASHNKVRVVDVLPNPDGYGFVYPEKTVYTGIRR